MKMRHFAAILALFIVFSTMSFATIVDMEIDFENNGEDLVYIMAKEDQIETLVGFDYSLEFCVNYNLPDSVLESIESDEVKVYVYVASAYNDSKIRFIENEFYSHEYEFTLICRVDENKTCGPFSNLKKNLKGFYKVTKEDLEDKDEFNEKILVYATLDKSEISEFKIDAAERKIAYEKLARNDEKDIDFRKMHKTADIKDLESKKDLNITESTTVITLESDPVEDEENLGKEEILDIEDTVSVSPGTGMIDLGNSNLAWGLICLVVLVVIFVVWKKKGQNNNYEKNDRDYSSLQEVVR